MNALKKVYIAIIVFIVTGILPIDAFSQTYNGIYKTFEKGKCFRMYDDTAVYVNVESEPIVALNEFASLKKKKDKQTGRYTLLITLTEKGKTNFAKVTKESVGKKLAFIVNNILLMAPVVQQEIKGGEVMITGPEKRQINQIVKFFKEYKNQ